MTKAEYLINEEVFNKLLEISSEKIKGFAFTWYTQKPNEEVYFFENEDSQQGKGITLFELKPCKWVIVKISNLKNKKDYTAIETNNNKMFEELAK